MVPKEESRRSILSARLEMSIADVSEDFTRLPEEIFSEA